MTEDKKLIEKIKRVIAENDKEFEEKLESAVGEDAAVIDKIQLLMEKDEAMLEQAALKIEAEEEVVTEEENSEPEVDAEETELEEESDEAEATEGPAEVHEAEAEVEEEISEETEIEAEESEDFAEEVEVEEVSEASESEEEQKSEPKKEKVHKERKDYTAILFNKIQSKFDAWSPKTKLGKYFAKDRHNATFGVLAVLTCILLICEGVVYAIPQKVSIKYVSFAETKEVALTTRANTVEKAIKDSGLEIKDSDYVSLDLERKLKDGDELEIRVSKEADAEIVGKVQKINLIPGTVEKNLEFNNISADDDDIVEPGRDTEVSEATKLVVKEVHYKTEEKQEKVAAQNVVVLDPSLASGVVKSTTGHDGEGIFTYKTKYVNGAEAGTEKTVKEWVTEPEDTALRLGTSATGHSGTYKVSRSFISNTTAYYMGETARGASGGRCVYGTCAVDPSVFPYGTLLFVEGYGVAVANDCGGAIKGTKLDLWMRSHAEACRWGRRHVRAYVLTK